MSYRLTPRVQLRSSPATFSKAFSVYRGEPPRLVVAMAAEDITRLTILSLSMSTTVSPLSVSMEIPAYGATAAKAPLEPLKIERRKPGPHDVEIEILYCGICHSDVHKVNDDWRGTHFPVVRGHEIVGRVGGVGLGGLGHMKVRLAASRSARVTVLSTSRDKEKDVSRLGAKHFVATKEPSSLDPLQGRFSLIMDTVSAPHDLNKQLTLLRNFGTMVLVGLPPSAAQLDAFTLVHGNRRIAGSNIGGIPETQEMLDYCGKNGIVADVEVIKPDQINDAYKRMERGDVRYRFVIDAASLRA